MTPSESCAPPQTRFSSALPTKETSKRNRRDRRGFAGMSTLHYPENRGRKAGIGAAFFVFKGRNGFAVFTKQVKTEGKACPTGMQTSDSRSQIPRETRPGEWLRVRPRGRSAARGGILQVPSAILL